MSKLDDLLIVDEICERLAGGEALYDICADEHMPGASTVFARMAKDEALKTRIAHARKGGMRSRGGCDTSTEGARAAGSGSV